MTWEYNSYLAHHGVKGQKWGIRHYQNEDGTLTEEGQKRYQKMSKEDRVALATLEQTIREVKNGNEYMQKKKCQ